MRVALPIGLALAATAASSAITLRHAAPAPVAARVAFAPAPPQDHDEEPIEIEVLRPRPIDVDEPVPVLPRRAPAPPETRDARLTVRLVDAETGDAVAMDARLWRLGVPEDDRWSEGDAEIETIRVSEDGGSARDLVPGRYRLCCAGQRKDAEDPPEFVLRAGDNEFTASVRVARTIPLWLLVVDQDGRPIDAGRCRETGRESRYRDSRRHPAWARRRAEKREDGSRVFYGARGGHISCVACSRGGPQWRDAEAGPEGFPLGIRTEHRRNARETWGWRFEFEGRSAVLCGPSDGTWGTGTFVSPSVTRERLLEGVLPEDGGTALDRGATVTAVAEAIPIRDGSPADAWRSIPIRVKVSLAGYRTLEFEFRLGDDPITRTMERDE